MRGARADKRWEGAQVGREDHQHQQSAAARGRRLAHGAGTVEGRTDGPRQPDEAGAAGHGAGRRGRVGRAAVAAEGAASSLSRRSRPAWMPFITRADRHMGQVPAGIDDGPGQRPWRLPPAALPAPRDGWGPRLQHAG